MKTGYIVLALVLSGGLGLVGALCKIMHYPGADVLLLSGLVSVAIASGLLLVKLVRS